MKRSSRLTAVLAGLLVGMGFKSLATVLKNAKPSREKVLLIALLIGVLSIAIGCLLWAAGAI